MRVAWLCPFPVDILPYDEVEYSRTRKFHPATWLVNLSHAVSECEGLDLHIVTETAWVGKDFRFKHNNISYHILRSPYSIPFMQRGLPGFLPVNVDTKYSLDLRKIRKELESISPDLIHSHGTEFQYSYVATKMDVPSVISVQGVAGFLKEFLKEPRWKKREAIEVETIRNGRNFISRAKFTDEYILRYNPGAVISHIDDIVDDEFFNSVNEPAADSLLFVGSVIRSKGIEELLAAFVELLKPFPGLTLRIAGHYDDRYRNYLRSRYLSEQTLAEKVFFLGQLNRKELLDEYRRASIFVLPSYFETSPNVVMEAMSVGLPIVATKVGGIPDMVEDNRSGILVREISVEELIDAIRACLSDAETRDKFRVSGKNEALKRYKKEIVARQTLDLYGKILSRAQ